MVLPICSFYMSEHSTMDIVARTYDSHSSKVELSKRQRNVNFEKHLIESITHFICSFYMSEPSTKDIVARTFDSHSSTKWNCP